MGRQIEGQMDELLPCFQARSTTFKNRSKSLIIKLIQALHGVHLWYQFGVPTLNLLKLLRVQCLGIPLVWLCDLEKRVSHLSSNSLMVFKYFNGMHLWYLWYQTGGPALNLLEVIDTRVFTTGIPLVWLCDLEK